MRARTPRGQHTFSVWRKDRFIYIYIYIYMAFQITNFRDDTLNSTNWQDTVCEDPQHYLKAEIAQLLCASRLYTRVITVHIICCAHIKYSAAAWTDRSLLLGRHSAIHRVWPEWCCRGHQADRRLYYGDKGMDGNELVKIDSHVAVTDTYNGIFFWTLILTMDAHVNSVCRSYFFHLHNISSIRMSVGYEDSCHHCPGPSHFRTWLLQLSAMWTSIYTHKEVAEGAKC